MVLLKDAWLPLDSSVATVPRWAIHLMHLEKIAKVCWHGHILKQNICQYWWVYTIIKNHSFSSVLISRITLSQKNILKLILYITDKIQENGFLFYDFISQFVHKNWNMKWKCLSAYVYLNYLLSMYVMVVRHAKSLVNKQPTFLPKSVVCSLMCDCP